MVDVRLQSGGDFHQIMISDSGPGIPPEYVERIFDPFWTTRTTGEGTGLGLSLAHSIVTDHSGRIAVDGGGTYLR